MAVRDDLGTRMKEFYEQVPKTRLVSLSTALRWIFLHGIYQRHIFYSSM